MNAATFRRATLGDVEMMLDWAAAEGWNPGLDDAAPFHSTDPGGFLISEIGGAPAAAISVVNHSDRFAFLGFYICRPEFRGRGISFELWQHGLKHAGDRTIGLDGVADQEANYARSGFVRAGASTRLEGQLAARASKTIRLAGASDQVSILGLDLAATGVSRIAFLNGWTKLAGGRRTMVLDTGEGPIGFATARRCREGVKIGPIIAPEPDQGLALAQALIAEFPSTKAIIDLPSSSAGLRDRLRALGFSETFATARMYRGQPPASGPSQLAIATMELG